MVVTLGASSNPVEVLKDERRRIDLFHSFWDFRIDIESNYIRALEGLVFDVPGPAGSLKDALDALNALVRIEINQRTVILGMLRGLRGDDSSPFGGWGYTSGASWLTSVASELQRRTADLAKQKSEVASHEGVVEQATVPRTEVVQQSNDNPSPRTRRAKGKRKSQPSPDKKPLVTISPSFTEFNQADLKYRNSVADYNELRRQCLGSSMQMAEKMATEEFEAITMVQKMISAFVDSQSDLASALNSGSSQCRFIANKISPSTEGNDSLTRVQNSLSVAFGRPHLYKNFWFGAGNNGRSPTILFAYLPKSHLGDTASGCVMRVFEVLVKHDPLLSLGPSNNSSRGDHEKLSKLAHDLETCWDPEEVDGGNEVVRLLTTQPAYNGLLLHFLKCMPEPLVDAPHRFNTTSYSNFFQYLCKRCNDSSWYSERKILSMVLRLLADCSKDEMGVNWAWWDQGDRKKLWGEALTHKLLDHNMTHVLPLWVHCVEYSETGEFVFLRANLDRWHQSWNTWSRDWILGPLLTDNN